NQIGGRRGGQILLQDRGRMGGDSEAQADAEQKDETDEFHSKAFQQIVAGALECSCRTVVALNQTDENSSRPSLPDGESPSPAPCAMAALTATASPIPAIPPWPFPASPSPVRERPRSFRRPASRPRRRGARRRKGRSIPPRRGRRVAGRPCRRSRRP